MAELLGVAATTVTCYPAFGVDPLDFVGAGVEEGAGAGADGGGASVGDGLGAADVGVVAGCELGTLLAAGDCADELGAAELVADELADDDVAGWLELDTEPAGDGLAPDAPAEDCDPDVVPATLCAAVFANRVAIPNAATALRSVARQVSLDSRRSPESRRALRSRCFMAQLHQGRG